MALRLVPFSALWMNHDKIDVHAIYRRPRYVEDEFGEMQREVDKQTGLPTWDLTGPLPVRQHARWSSKGFVYVTLANRESLAIAARFGTLPEGTTAKDFDQHQTGGPWSFRKYIQGQEIAQLAEADEIERDVYEFGSHAVETIRKRSNPDFALPVRLQGIVPRGPVVVAKADEGDPDPEPEPEAAGVGKAKGRK